MSDNQRKWYVLRAIGGKEKKVKEYIDNEVANSGLQEFVSQVLIPVEKVYQIRNGKKVAKDRNFFPGYILIEAALVGEISHMLRNVPNVIGFWATQKGANLFPCVSSKLTVSLGKWMSFRKAEKNLIPHS